MNARKVKKINIGSGPRGKSDWINLDWGILALLSKAPWLVNLVIKLRLLPSNYTTVWQSKPRLWDCRKRLPFATSSVDYIYTSHFLEHLYRYQVIKLLIECKRVLRPGGIMRVVVPDLKIFAKRYVNNDMEFFRSLSGAKTSISLENISDLLVYHFYGYDCWCEPTFLQKLHRIFIRGHLWMYDYESLSKILYEVGFTNVWNCQGGVGKVPDIDFLDVSRDNSLFIEASF